jgi:hypothetical protein
MIDQIMKIENTLPLLMVLSMTFVLTACCSHSPKAASVSDNQTPEPWFKQARVGLMIHWGPGTSTNTSGTNAVPTMRRGAGISTNLFAVSGQMMDR